MWTSQWDGTGGHDYLQTIGDRLQELLDNSAESVIYNAGVDPIG